MELMTNNLMAMVNGNELTLHQKAAAKMEYLKLLETIQILETKVENLDLHSVSQQRELLLAYENFHITCDCDSCKTAITEKLDVFFTDSRIMIRGRVT